MVDSVKPTPKFKPTSAPATSDIHGSGWGFGHDWKVGATSFARVTPYTCRDCGIIFGHAYGVQPSIGRAMYEAGIPNTCAAKATTEPA